MHYNQTATALPLPALLTQWQVKQQTIAQSQLWFFLLTATAVASNSIYYCTVPLVGFGIIAGSTLPRRKAITVLLTMWLVNQLLGFTVRHYPWTFSTFAWGWVMGIGAVLATLLASVKPKFSQKRLSGHLLWLGTMLLTGYIFYELVIWLAGFALGAVEGFTLPILWGIFVGNAMWALALTLIHGIIAWRTSPSVPANL